MPVIAERVGRAEVLRVRGPFDVTTAGMLERAAAAAMDEVEMVIVDLESASDISPSALRVILMLSIALARRGQTLCLCPPDTIVRESFNASDLQVDIVFVPSVEAALQVL